VTLAHVTHTELQIYLAGIAKVFMLGTVGGFLCGMWTHGVENFSAVSLIQSILETLWNRKTALGLTGYLH
jgi:hypothetical protein